MCTSHAPPLHMSQYLSVQWSRENNNKNTKKLKIINLPKVYFILPLYTTNFVYPPENEKQTLLLIFLDKIK